MNNSRIKKVIKVLLFFMFLLVFQIFNSSEIYASNKSKKDIGEYIAEFAVNFESQHGKETVYSWNNAHRAAAYKGFKTSGIQETWEASPKAFSNMYAMDCVGWVSMAIHQSTGLNNPVVENGSCGFVTPDSGNGYCAFSNGYFEVVSGAPQVGDILIRPDNGGIGHVMIYVGNNQMVDSSGGFTTVQRRPIGQYSYIARITDAGVAAINDSDLTTIFNGHGSITGSLRGGGFNYNGLQEGRFGVESIWECDWVIPSLAELADWFFGIVTYLIRAVFVGWVGIVETLINNTMEAVTGVEASLTIEKLLFNKVPILDVNFFNFEQAGGWEFGEDSVLYIIRENIAAWYYIIRNLSIIVLLITLIYLGIRMAISSIAEEKAKYKDLLTSWVVSFIIVFSIHYVMLFILNINESLIGLISSLRK